MNIPVNMSTEELDLCGECKHLVYRGGAGLLDIFQNGPWYADTEAMHAHQPARARYEAKRLYGPQAGTHGVFDTETRTWVHVGGIAQMTQDAAEHLARDRNASARATEGNDNG